MKILCPNHKDSTPSLHLYDERAWCFVCNYSCPIEEVATAEQRIKIRKEPTDVRASIEFIKTLPVRKIRGLQFPVNDTGFYIVWPNLSFYKKRLTGERTRYLGPRGIRPPIFSYTGSNKEILVLVEGEINCMSLREAFPSTKITVASPGSASQFNQFVPFYLTYKTIYCIVDKDAAGVANGVVLKRELMKSQKRVELVALEMDFNDVLVESGTDGIKQKVKQEAPGLEL